MKKIVGLMLALAMTLMMLTGCTSIGGTVTATEAPAPEMTAEATVQATDEPAAAATAEPVIEATVEATAAAGN